jgi:hypothetical protein
MFPEDLFQFVLEQLADEIAGGDTPLLHPLATDSFIARSVLQKAIRRGMTDLALRAAVTLVASDSRVLWRRLLVTALEDLGVGEVDLLVRIVAASRDRAWRSRVGGDWPVIANLIKLACAGTRCQAANDLWNIAKNDPDLDTFKSSLCDAELGDLLVMMADGDRPISHRGVAVLIALGEDAGPAAPTHITPDAGAIFAAFAGLAGCGHVTAAYSEAFRQSRLALAPLGLILMTASQLQSIANRDDPMPNITWANDIPRFARDQYTRTGKAAIRAYCRASDAWAMFARKWDLPPSVWNAAAGELLFRTEGALVTNRRAWELGLALYDRSILIGCFMPQAAVPEGMALILRQLPLIDQLRSGHQPTKTPG